MKILIAFFIVVLFIGCSSPKPHSKISPQWYLKQEIIVEQKSTLVGYGEGESLHEAKAQAKEDIASTLQSKVKSLFRSEMNDNEAKHSSKLSITSSMNLDNVKVLKQENIDGIYFVALSYENLEFSQKVKQKLQLPICEDENVNSYLSQTMLYNNLSKTLGCQLNFKLHRQSSAWYLKYKKDMFLLSESEFEKLYISTKSKEFEFLASQNSLIDGNSFYFKFVAHKEGYITLLNVYENGIVTLLKSSIKISKYLQIPSKESQNYFEAGVIEEGKDTHDLYIAIWSEKPLDMSRFTHADEELNSNESAYKFDELIELLDTKEYSSILLRTKVK